MKRFIRSRKALSPVVASIILIAVTVAVSIAVAAWMGALTVGFMSTEQVKITNVAFGTDTPQTVTVSIQNTGPTSVTINEIYFANVKVAGTITWATVNNSTLGANEAKTATWDQSWDAGSQYMVKVVTSQGNPFTFTAIAPY